MKIRTLALTNFQGVKNAIFNFDGKNVDIYGDNATGKTTIFNAFTWLLFGKASTKEASSFTPKTRTSNGEAHNLEHSAEMEIETYPGCVVAFKKVFKEVYKKKRGSASEEFSGHTIDYYVNGVPVKEKEYTSSLEEHCGNMEHLKVLTAPDYFPDRMTWQQRRTLLISLFGDVSDADIIDSKPELRELPSLLRIGTSEQYYSIPDYIKIAVAKRREINEKLQTIPSRIDEASRAIPDIVTLTMVEIKSMCEGLDERRIALLTKKSDYLNGGVVKELKEKLDVAQLKFGTAYSRYLNEVNAANAEVNKKLEILGNERFQTMRDINDARLEISRRTADMGELDAEKKRLLAKYERIREQQFLGDSCTCPFCKQTLPAEEVEKKKAEFNLAKSRELEKLHSAICKIETSVETFSTGIATLQAKLADAEGRLKFINSQIESLQSERQQFPEFAATEEGIAICEEIARIEETLSNAEAYAAERATEIDVDLKAITDEMDALIAEGNRLTFAATQRERIRELEEQEQRLANEYEHIEMGLYLCELFTRTKAAALTDKINAQFKNVKFSLFKEQINGGIAEDCEVMIPTSEGNMVPYKDSNNAAKINAGLEIIDVLSECLELSAPVFIDNAESVTHIIGIEPQVIRLVVSEADKVLRLEEQ